MKVLVIANLSSGKGKCKRKLPAVESILKNKGIEHEVYKTVGREQDVRYIADNINSYDLAICMGGDGTLNGVLNALIKGSSYTPIGYIPCGSTNDFGATHKLSAAPEKAIEAMLSGKTNMLDVGCLNGQYFCYVAAAGFFSDISFGTASSAKHLLGNAAYLLEGAKMLPKIKPISLKIQVEGEIYEGNYIVVGFSNSSRIGGLFKFGKDTVDCKDGLMELSLFKDPANPIAFVGAMTDLLAGNLKNKYYHMLHTDRVVMESEINVDWSVDGEYAGNFKTADLSVIKNRFPLIC